MRPVGESPIGLKITFCSSALSPEEKGQQYHISQRLKTQRGERLQQEGDEIDQMANRRMYRRSRLTSPKERGRKTKTTKLIVGGIGSTWVQLERVNPSPSPTHSARESEWDKVEAVLKAATRCSRETKSIQ
ncbi:hypothetical protein H5410_050862, partial [Solanum commersonii]